MPLVVVSQLLLYFAIMLMLLQSASAFRPSAASLADGASIIVENKDLDTDLIAGIAASRQDGSQPPSARQREWEDDGLLLDAGTSREGFLRNVVGLGAGLAAGMVCEPEPAHALFGESGLSSAVVGAASSPAVCASCMRYIIRVYECRGLCLLPACYVGCTAA